ncbi:MAG: penicillin acylase family protein, partial [Geminicoccaceae bacterium]
AVGMMIPGLPFMGLGRNADIAWGGTNARALSSDVVNVAGNGEIEAERVTLRTRWWFDQELTRRRSPEGPILSDSRFIAGRAGEVLALRWVGHEPTDEITAFLEAMRASDVESFRQAFASYGVSAQNMLVADRHGRIAKVMAAQLPQRGPRPADDFVLQNRSAWNGFDSALTMGWVVDPASGFIASGNDRPDYIGRPAGYFFSPRDRVLRMATLVEERGTLGVEDLFAIQQDVVSEPAAVLAAGLVERADALHLLHPLLAELRLWDGAYAIEARGPVVFETILYHLTRELYANSRGEVSRELTSWANLQLFLLADLDAHTPQRRLEILQAALANAAGDAARYANWGEMHRIRVGHVLGNLPVIGGFFRIADLPSAGSRETLMKRSHNLERGRHRATFGAQSRHVSDLADVDANWFVLFGGQDGWLGSTNFADQVDLWKSGNYLQLPLSPAAVERAFPIVMRTTTSGG